MRCSQLREGIDNPEGCDRKPLLLQGAFFPDAVLAECKQPTALRNGHLRFQKLHSGHRDILELVGHKVAAFRQFCKCRTIPVGCGNHLGPREERRTFRIWIQRNKTEAHRVAGVNEHLSELASAEQADG